MTAIAERITRKLTEAFAPQQLAVIDDSHRHEGHSGWREGGETHFNVTIRAGVFAPMNRVARHRAVHHALGDLTVRIHALSLDIA